MSDPAIFNQKEQPYQQWVEEDEELLQLCIEHEPSQWAALFSSNDIKDNNKIETKKMRQRNYDDDSSSDVELDPRAKDDELLLQLCIQYDPWNHFFCWDKTQKSSSELVGNLRRVSSVGSLRRVHSRTRLA
mmetsp:Transcript_18450/g.27879  ORF Transcript_18450/g.27879 Transcript_18450/m.27879 type:complete len:131 (-) Transcript_18450:106-498(-)|eukprot:CAMPEP_0178920836 /NCGR_PEP_ID=MMETSP0786-20121207/15221_1 /TAXON_ID=186022 /ORGANISM="Thalassionema frauenfeldii, Strain CCMP 1798" /LENGTH=130 /DNA_ID=CAMNT_0020594937 /DNA_START=119 /DNA_END=511 /DNA_ORIENTATION=-